jgi:hypothetical protein
VKRLPSHTVERLRGVTDEDLQRVLGVMVQYETRDGRLVPAEPGPNIEPKRGTRHKDGVVQLGLTEREIKRVRDRIDDLLKRVDKGDVQVF